MVNTSLVLKKDRNGDIKQIEKRDLFLKELLVNGGNATEAAMTVFKLENRSSASVIGSRYLKEAKEAGRVYMEKKGFTYGKLLELAMEKAMASKNTEWFDRLMKIAGYEDFMSKSQSGVNVNILTAGNQKDSFKGFVEEGEVVDGEESTPVEVEVEEEDEIDPTIARLVGEDNESN